MPYSCSIQKYPYFSNVANGSICRIHIIRLLDGYSNRFSQPTMPLIALSSDAFSFAAVYAAILPIGRIVPLHRAIPP